MAFYFSRLIREDNKKLDKTFFYEYDKGGNIVRKTSYKYNLNNRESITSTATTYNYEYPTSGWKDQMLSFNGLKCEYDALGNPTKYKNKNLVWGDLRTLESYDNVSYTYDNNGIRTSKTVTTTTTDDAGVETTKVVTKKFVVDGNKVIMQDNGDADENSGFSKKLFFHYGADGITGFTLRTGKYEGSFKDYFYKKNAQGDIIGIYDQTGKEVARYYYDAWGNCDTYYFISTSMYKVTATTTSSYATIAILNPFRYRGYYYDSETNLYYLNSRYYDPETGRFINADDYSILFEGKDFINGLNLYAYCGNNPVMNTDECGHAWWHWAIGIGVIAVAFGLTVATAGSFTGALAAVLGEFKILEFSAVGGMVGTFANITAGTIVSGVVGFISGGIISFINKESFLEGASKGLMWGSVTGLVSGLFGSLNNIKSPSFNISIGKTNQNFIQGSISYLSYLFRTVIEKEDLSQDGIVISVLNGLITAILGDSVLKTQAIVAALFELGNIAWENAKNKVYEAVEFYRKLFNKNQYFGV